MGNNGSNYSGVNQMAQNNLQNYQGQRNDFGNVLYSGLGNAYGSDQGLLNQTAGAYGSFIDQMKSAMGGGPGGGSLAGNQYAQTLAGLSGPGNPWAGQLGADVRTRENSVLPGFYDQIRSAQSRLQNVQGGYNPGFTAQMSKLSRDQAEAGQKAVLNTEIEIGQKSAAAQAAQANFEMQKNLALAQMQQAAGQASAANWARTAGLQLSGIGGLASLYGQAPANTGMWLGALGNNLTAGQQGSTAQMGQLMQYNQPTTPWWQTALSGGLGLSNALSQWL